MEELTVKQENFCQAYLRLGDKSAAYREAYDCENMKAETIHVKASELASIGKVAVRIAELRDEAAERNKISLDEIIGSMAEVVRFDIAELYDEDNKLKSIHFIPKSTRNSITQIEVFEEFQGQGSERQLIGHTKKIRVLNKLDAAEKLIKHLGGYEKDNKQQAQANVPTAITVQIVRPDESEN